MVGKNRVGYLDLNLHSFIDTSTHKQTDRRYALCLFIE